MSEPEVNPYAAPKDLSVVPMMADTLLFFRDGRFLTVRDGAELPDSCMVTNKPAQADHWRKRVRIVWTPPWVFITIFVHIVITLILSLLLRKKAMITYSLCRSVRARIVRRRILAGLLLVAAPALMVAAFLGDGDPLTGIMLASGFASLIVGLIMLFIANPIKVLKHRGGWFRLKGCSAEFLQGLPEHPSPF